METLRWENLGVLLLELEIVGNSLSFLYQKTKS